MSAEVRALTIWDRERLGISLGAAALIFLAAIESLAVTTVMPVVAEDLDGMALYAVAFAGTLATSVIGMVAAGAWSDRAGPRRPLYAAVILFIIGLVVAGIATTMPVFLLGRLVQGLGAGAQTVALYVVVARVYPAHLHGRIFAVFAAAWVVPSMIGPFLAGAVTEFLHWRWAFLGVAVLVVIAFTIVAVKLRAAPLGPIASGSAEGDASTPGAKIGLRMFLAVVIALSAVGVGFAAEIPGVLGWAAAAGCVLVIAIAIVPLVPKGMLRARPGLPSVVLLRGIVAGAFFAAEAYIPFLLMAEFDFSPTWAGLALTLAALAWASGSALQGRYGEAIGSRRIAALSLLLLGIGMVSLLIVALSGAAPWLAIIGWGFAGGGMGLLYPRLTVLTLAFSRPGTEGFNSAALSISDATGAAVAIAVAGLAFATVSPVASGFLAVFGVGLLLVLGGIVPGLRLGSAPIEERR